MKKPKFRRFGISTGSKVQQANLRALAREMGDDPAMLIPECAGKCSRCQYDKLLARLRKIQAHRDNPDVLRKLASGGKPLERGYAAMLLIAKEDSPLMFATAKLPTGDVGYTVRGKVKKEVLIGLQHFDDPRLRLLAYSEFSLKRRLHLYSLEDGLMCSGTLPGYPPELLAEVMRKTNYALRRTQSGFGCEHAGQGPELRIRIVSADQTIRLCKSCASRKHNMFTELTSRVMARRPEQDFQITVEHGILCRLDDGCTLSCDAGEQSELVSDYRAGKLSDQALIDGHRASVIRHTGRSGRAVFVMGDTCFEGDTAAFIEALVPTSIERTALEHVLRNANSPVVMDTATPNAVLALFWDRLGASAINSVIGDKELARIIYSETRDSGKNPSQILRDAKIRSQSKSALAALPEFRGLSQIGRYADDLAKTYKALGKEEALRRLTAQGDTRFKSLVCGFLKTLDALKGKEWQFTKEELDYGSYLADFAGALLDSRPDEYADALGNLLAAAGSDDVVR